MTIEEIRANAPKGATDYFQHTGNYLKNMNGTWFVWNDNRWLLVKQITYLCSIMDSIKPLN